MAPTDKSQKGKKTRSALNDVVTREYTIHLHKRVHDTAFKKRAPKGVKEVVKFAQKAMGTKDVRLDPKLNQEVWKFGVKDVPRRIRVRLERKRNDDEDAKEKLYTYATPVLGITNFHGLETAVIEQDE
ncbi:60S ribosomal protein L31 [Malassezia psittaci]|uniref:60S ribosomal protein L31 n=1 Tax=Malassezia psittaci TaxID=1821823 RepID=A0AAF0FDX8_9BASI|nr:60S ribosomal protein L31 [Malassezia psittaci]